MSVSTFTLEDDAIVSGSSFLQELETSGLPIERPDGQLSTATRPLSPVAHGDGARRRTRGWSCAPGDRRGTATATTAPPGRATPEVYAVSHVERYLACPFKYFAARVLRLDEEREDESGLSPQERGQLLHEVFQTFFARWQERGGGAITADSLAEALELFTVGCRIDARAPAAKPTARSSGPTCSARRWRRASGERAFNFEIEQEVPVLERLLEHSLEGTFEFKGADGPRAVTRSRQGRSHRFARGWDAAGHRLQAGPRAEDGAGAAAAGLQRLRRAAAEGPAWTHVDGRRPPAMSRSRRRTRSCRSAASTSLPQALDDGAARFVAAVEGIERGEFPGAAGGAVPVHVVRLRGRLPKGLRWRRVTHHRRPSRSCRSSTRRRTRRCPKPHRRRHRLSHRAACANLGSGAADAARARSRRQRAQLRRRARQQRRARGVGGHRQDVGPRRALRQPAQARRRSGEHPRDHLHAQGRRRDARADRARARRGGERSEIDRVALARAARPPGRYRHQHDRRVLSRRCCASFRSRPISTPGSTSRTRPRCRASSRTRSIKRCEF